VSFPIGTDDHSQMQFLWAPKRLVFMYFVVYI